MYIFKYRSMFVSIIPHDKANHTPAQANQTARSTDLIFKLPKSRLYLLLLFSLTAGSLSGQTRISSVLRGREGKSKPGTISPGLCRSVNAPKNPLARAAGGAEIPEQLKSTDPHPKENRPLRVYLCVQSKTMYLQQGLHPRRIASIPISLAPWEPKIISLPITIIAFTLPNRQSEVWGCWKKPRT